MEMDVGDLGFYMNAFIIGGVIFLIYCIRRVPNAKPDFYFDPNSQQSAFLASAESAPSLHKVYVSTWWLFNGHFHTLYASIAKSWNTDIPVLASNPDNREAIWFEREIVDVLPLKKGFLPGKIAIDWCKTRSELSSESSLLILFPGLTGDSNSEYIKTFAKGAANSGSFRIVVINYRGSSGVPLINSQLYCGAYTDDMRQAILYVTSRYPNANAFGVGFSIGSNILMKYLGEEKELTPLTAAVAVSSPFDLLLSTRRLHGNWFTKKLYSEGLTKSLLEMATLHKEWLDGVHTATYEEVMQAKTLSDFDDLVTRRVFGYRTTDHYYRDSSSACNMWSIGIPLLCISALDDPICHAEAIPFDEFKISKNAILATLRTGGHGMLFHYGPHALKSLSYEAAMDFFNSVQKLQRRSLTSQSDRKHIQTQLNEEEQLSHVLDRMISLNSSISRISEQIPDSA